MRIKRKAKQCEYILIAGYSYSHPGHAPAITLNRGNGYGEEIVSTLQTFPIGTPYKAVSARAEELSKQLNVTLGRKFTSEEWLGPEV